ncbi:zf-HC2 domain-containing protein [Streptomyces sp. NPDC014870]|uniref:zf-HC2 domain-containing protein n=1 Tax=Streptomyces sp. NPDC014870 TaxID=3364925 RepID=UPI0036F81D4B
MTSTTGKADTAQHPDVSEISDLAEGLLSPSRTAAVRRHIEGCSLCADVRTSLAEIRGLLGTLPGPPRMPADIAGRIDAALAAEALLNATTPDIDLDVSRETASSTPPAPPATASTEPAPVAERPAGHPRAATGPGRRRRSRRRIAALGTVLGVAALGTSLFLTQGGLQSLGGSDSADKTSSAASGVVSDTFDGRPMEAQVQDLLRPDTLKAPGETQPESLTAEGGDAPYERNASEPLPECVKAGTGRSDAALAFQRGDYEGKPAYLVVLPQGTQGTHVQAYVLDASCADQGGQGKADVLLTQTYPRS